MTKKHLDSPVCISKTIIWNWLFTWRLKHSRQWKFWLWPYCCAASVMITNISEDPDGDIM